MVTAAHLVYAVAQTALLVLAVRLLVRDRHWTLLVFVINIAGLVYDNLVIGLGHLIGPGETLMALNYPRFLVHAATTPLLGMLGLYLTRNTGVDWAWGRKALITFWTLTLAMLGWAIYNDLVLLRMEPVAFAETVRYANAAVSGPPLPAITVMTLVMFCGIAVFVRARWPWLFLGSLVVFTTAAFAASIGVVANLGEIFFVAGTIATGYRFPRLSHEEHLRRQRVLSPAERERLANEQRGRKRRLAIGNRWMAWAMAVTLLVGTLAYYREPWGLLFIPAWVDPLFNNSFLILFFVHATASFYFYGVPRPRASIRVAHVYIGYGVFIFTMISQSLIGVEPIHMITYVINWLFIGAHILLSLRFLFKRASRQKQDPMLEFVVSKKLAPTSGD
jgi:hypothetical protein